MQKEAKYYSNVFKERMRKIIKILRTLRNRGGNQTQNLPNKQLLSVFYQDSFVI
jgi:hypothetical protein